MLRYKFTDIDALQRAEDLVHGNKALLTKYVQALIKAEMHKEAKGLAQRNNLEKELELEELKNVEYKASEDTMAPKHDGFGPVS